MRPLVESSRAVLVRVYAALLALLALTAVGAHLPLGPWSLPLALGIAVGKLLLIFTFFMQLRLHRGLLWVFAAAGFFWLGIALTLTFSDYLTRSWLF